MSVLTSEQPGVHLPKPEVESMTSFEQVARTYPEHGEPGIEWVRKSLRLKDAYGFVRKFSIETLLYRDDDGELVGWFHHYPQGIPFRKERGEYSVSVEMWHRKRGIGRKLLAFADELWGINFEIQHYTVAGRTLACNHLQEKGFTVE